MIDLIFDCAILFGIILIYVKLRGRMGKIEGRMGKIEARIDDAYNNTALHTSTLNNRVMNQIAKHEDILKSSHNIIKDTLKATPLDPVGIYIDPNKHQLDGTIPDGTIKMDMVLGGKSPRTNNKKKNNSK